MEPHADCSGCSCCPPLLETWQPSYQHPFTAPPCVNNHLTMFSQILFLSRRLPYPPQPEQKGKRTFTAPESVLVILTISRAASLVQNTRESARVLVCTFSKSLDEHSADISYNSLRS
ncbi:hypothetical protein I7I50_00681 [Histoplasma capsulatum G186AR]|uniref:Uncharacterized protein n=1 Tax=Ajellomyces capsulatus TaxID=5037 RepID=A0A8H7YJA4_AJECA|nr:hypothetical protein I7I52_07949 [Histoplasma capsulatum]QSS72745.1 hypothetical protein I7I50_00681 [Histoplasma capsulatum G186AR]